MRFRTRWDIMTPFILVIVLKRLPVFHPVNIEIVLSRPAGADERMKIEVLKANNFPFVP